MGSQMKAEACAATNVVPFPGVRAAIQPLPVAKSAVAAIASSSATLCSALLLQGVGDLENAVDKVARMVMAMPEGEARHRAEDELMFIRAQLETARTMSREVAPGPSDRV